MDELSKKFLQSSDINFEDLTIFIRYKKDESNQMWIRFKNTYDNFSSMNITYFNKYRKIKDTTEKVSLFGNESNKILFYLVKDFISKLVPVGDEQSFIIGMGETVPEDIECHILSINKINCDYTCNKECPVCYTDYKIKEYVRLNCYHKICRDCLFTILDKHTLKCPVCKEPILDSYV